MAGELTARHQPAGEPVDGLVVVGDLGDGEGTPLLSLARRLDEIERLNPGKKVVLADVDPGLTPGPPGRPRH